MSLRNSNIKLNDKFRPLIECGPEVMGIVYQHRTKDTNQIFYIGISKGTSRPYSIQNRNK